MRSCCFCLTLRRGSLALVWCRLLFWSVVSLAMVYMATQIFHPDSGLLPYEAKTDIESNVHVLVFIVMYSLLSLLTESLMVRDLFNSSATEFRHLRSWSLLTLLSLFLSVVLALNFVLGILEIPSRPETGHNWLSDALCVLIHIVFFFIPHYLLGPRITPVFIALMILIHLFLPCFHLYAYLVVRAHVRQRRHQARLRLQADVAPRIDVHSVTPVKNLCEKCRLAQMENGRSCNVTPNAKTNNNSNNSNNVVNHSKPVETTC